MYDLPQDIWVVIIQHLQVPRSKVMRLMTVNRALFNLVLDESYRNVEWVRLDHTFRRSLARLQDPEIARRVRQLHIRPWFLQALTKENIRREISQTQKPLLRGLRKRASRTFMRLKTSSDPQLPSLSKEMLEAMMNALAKMTRMTEFSFEWRDLPLNGLTRNLLTTSKHAFGACLSMLTLSARVSQLKDILFVAAFVALQDLRLEFAYDPLDANIVDTSAINEAIFMNSVAPFINGNGTSLRRLKISSSAKGDHSALLRHIERIGNLRCLVLRISFDGDELKDGDSIYRILDLHRSSLTSVELRPNPSSPREPREGDESTIHRCNKLHSLATLCTLSINDAAWMASLDSLTIPTYYSTDGEFFAIPDVVDPRTPNKNGAFLS
ncbi:hypothetical protein DXG01_002712 [Tephrocybe rancida]|nr:hypothetical protein DXG01_002712 [Tephrocybe rancida]